MAGRSSRAKGARGEREVIQLLQPVVDAVCKDLEQPTMVLRRNADQRYAPDQYDIIGLPWLAIEVKRVENLSGMNSWWSQVTAATGLYQIPVLFYRQNHKPWHIRTKLPVSILPGTNLRSHQSGAYPLEVVVDMKITEWLAWFEKKLRYELSR